MVSEEVGWLRISENLWISASIVSGREISNISFPSEVVSPRDLVPTIESTALGLKRATQNFDRIFLGSVSVRDGANIRAGPGLEHEIVSAVFLDSLVALVAVSQDRKWMYLQDGLWMSEDLVSVSRVYSIVKRDEAISPIDEVVVADTSQERIEQSPSTGYRATVISESGAGIRSGPGFEYELVATKSLGQEVVYLAQSNNRE